MGRKVLDAACLVMLVLGSCVLPVFVYDTVSVQQFEAVWDMNPRALYLYTKQADMRYEVAMQHMIVVAREQGFVFRTPRLVQTNILFDVWHPRWSHTGWMCVDPNGGRRILIDDHFVKRMSDDDLECTIAHELGHVIDQQMHREGHRAFWPIRCYDEQRFADEIGRMLC